MMIEKERDIIKITIGILILIAFFFVIQNIEPTLTGMVVYEGEVAEKIWAFDNPAEYIYDESVINLNVEEVKLISTSENQEWTTEEISEVQISSATLHKSNGETQDKTAETQTVDEEFVNLNKENYVLDVTFPVSLTNGDIISLYLLEGNNVQTDIYLCDAGTSCPSPGYGLVNFNEEEGWYDLTISGLSSPTETLAIDPPHHIKVDYIKARHTEIIEYSTTITTYPTSAEIQTTDFQPENLAGWESLTVSEELNGQSIGYYYSTNSGISWITVLENKDLSEVETSSGKIRIKAILLSNTTETSVLSSISLSYTELACTENWTANYGTCAINNTQLKTYFDSSECGTVNDLPEDNGTIVSCDYCTPNIANTSWSEWNNSGPCLANDLKLQSRYFTAYDINNCGEVENETVSEEEYTYCDYCTPRWEEVNTSCWPGNTFTGWFNDTNHCYSLTALESDNDAPDSIIYSCDYCAMHNCTGSDGVVQVNNQTNQTFNFNAANETHTQLEINSRSNLTTHQTTVVEYSYNLKNSTPDKVPLNRYVEIESNLSDIDSAKIIVYYTDEEISNSGIEESTLRIHYYNKTSEEWEELLSVVNTTENYVYALVSHLSLYGLFGEEKSFSGGNTVSGSGGGGGGGSSRRTSTPATVKETKRIEASNVQLETSAGAEKKVELLPSKNCEYVLEVALPEEVSLMNEEAYEGKIINKGNCEIQQLELYAGPELSSFISLSPTTITSLALNNNATFRIIRTSESKKNHFSFFTSNAILEKVISKKISGMVTISGVGEEQVTFTKDIPLNIRVLSPILGPAKKIAWGVGLSMFISLILLLFILRQKKKRN